jgi:hypothetical protein
LLPKIHKPKDKWPNINMPEGRPIVSDTNSESCRISQFIDSYTRPISMKHFAFIKDSYDFNNKIRNQRIPSNALLVTGDVTALYTNMNIERTLALTKSALNKFNPNNIKLNDYLLKLLEITMKNNDFEFNNEYFLQICGTAMGKAYAPGLADLYMQELDNAACEGPFKDFVKLFFRFLDDISLVWLSSIEELGRFEIFLNSLIPGIKITLNHSPTSISFLDMTIYKRDEANGEASLQTKIYFKETDTHQLLHKDSSHPKHTFKGILKSQLLRFKRLSSCFYDFNSTCKILFDALTKRNYSKSLLRKMKRDIWNYSPPIAPAAAPKQKELPIVVPFCDVGISLSKKWKSVLGKNDKFNNTRLITAFCNTKNLRKTLVRSQLSNVKINRSITKNNSIKTWLSDVTRKQITVGNFKCSSTKCKACLHVVQSTVIKSSYNNRIFNVKNRFNCKSDNIIYLITCRKCRLQYVGQTGRSLADRITDHLSAIRTRKNTPIAVHFNLPGHSLDDFQIMAIEQISDNINALKNRLLKESVWQNLLQTAYPLGINNLKANYLL